jgi:hypothetical protein
MHAPERSHLASRRTLFAKSFFVAKGFVIFFCAAFACPLLCLSLISCSAAAQDYGHMRVQFSHGAAWTDTAPRPDSTAALPSGPAYAGYGYAHNADSGAPNDRVRLKASNFNGM